MLDTRFPHIAGDIGNPATFDFQVRYCTVHGASPQRVVREPDPTLLQPFIDAGRALIGEGATAITTSCRFPLLLQRKLQVALLNNAPTLDTDAARAETVAAALRLIARHPQLSTIVLECTNMPPYADAVRAATGRTAIDITALPHQRFQT